MPVETSVLDQGETIMKLRTLLLCALLASGLLPGCAPNTPSGDPETYGELIHALVDSGIKARRADPIEQEFFSAPGRMIKIGDETIQVFAYADPAARSEESALIGENPSSIGTTMITWVDTPHFWAQGRLIVLYVGSNQEVVAALNQMLGEPLATRARPGSPRQSEAVDSG